jgi:hypothetical protein
VFHDSGEGVRVNAYIRIQEQDHLTGRPADASVAGISRTTPLVESKNERPVVLGDRNRVVVGPIIHH